MADAATPERADSADSAETAESADTTGALAVDPEGTIDLLLRHLGTRPDGLTELEAARRLQQHGPNEIRRPRGRGHLKALALQFTNPLALLLWVAAGLAVLADLGPLAIAIVAVIVLNAVFAFVQELQAEHATEALREFLPLRALVRRNGRELDVDARELVPGDVLVIAEGDRLSADVRLFGGGIEADMSPLTGESQPVVRSAAQPGRGAPPLESGDLVFAGSLCTGGQAVGVVFATGMATQLGRIAALSQRVREELSPLQREVNRAAELIAAVAVAFGIVFLIIGVTLAGLPLSDAAPFAIGLIVANVPEGLLPTITLALAEGVRRMARRRALIKRLTAVETLGSTDVICTDKTGTLTTGEMTVRCFWAEGTELRPAADGRTLAAREPFSALLRTAVRCNNASARPTPAGWERRGDPTESALLLAAAELGEDVEGLLAGRDSDRLAVFGFDPHVKRMTTADAEPGGARWLHTKGAPLELLECCSAVRGAQGDRALSAEDRQSITDAVRRYAGGGLRVLGLAERRIDGAQPQDRDHAETQLTFVGLAVLEDPPRDEVAAAVQACRSASVRIIVISGDHALTVAAVAREVGIVGEDPPVLTGAQLDAMTDAQLHAALATPELVIARSSPETKLRVVDALRAAGHTVAMTGDGVNDAPALRRADIGVAMGATGTDVAREAATMVLTDDSFASIVAAVREGRIVFDNIRPFVLYIFAHATPEVVPFLLFALSGGAIPLPLTVMQILAIDLGTETLPALALGREPGEPGVMERPPRPRRRGILDRRMLQRAWLRIGLVEAALVCLGFLWVLGRAGWSPGDATGTGTPLHHAYVTATTMTFAGITACQVGTAFAARTTRSSLWAIGPFSNRSLLWGILFELAFAAAVIYVPFLQPVFHTAPLGPAELLFLVPFPFIVWGVDETWRFALRRRERGALAPAPVVAP